MFGVFYVKMWTTWICGVLFDLYIYLYGIYNYLCDLCDVIIWIIFYCM